MKEYLATNGWQGVLALVMLLNMALSGLSASLEAIKKAMNSPLEEQAQGFLNKLIFVLKKLVDIISANVAH